MTPMLILPCSAQAVLALDLTADEPDSTSEQALPSDFFTDVRIGKTLINAETGEMEPFGNNVAWDASCALWSSYTVPEYMTVHTAYTFSVAGMATLRKDALHIFRLKRLAQRHIRPNGFGSSNTL